MILMLVLCASTGSAQYYDWGNSPVSTKWRQLKTRDLRVIYPREFEANARRVMWYLDTIRTTAAWGYPHGTMPTPLVIRTANMQGNGMVMWAPRRMEFLAAPGATYSEPWLKQLAVHEYRHNVQYNNLRRGLMRPLMWLLGEQIAFLGVAQFSIFALEGDAVMAETEMSAFGRGLQPSWTMHYRAVGDVGTDKYSTDYWFSGSFRDYVPDHYRLGYQMVRWSYDHFGEFIWDDIARYVARNPQWIVPMGFGMRKMYGMGESAMFRRAFADLNAHWASLPKVEDSSKRIHTPRRGYTTYKWPQWMNDSTLVAVKSDVMSAPRIVRVDARTGREKELTKTGAISSRPALTPDGVLWWTEYRQSMLWSQKVNSRLVSYNPVTDLQAVHRPPRNRYYRGEQILYPTPMADGGFAYAAYDAARGFSLIIGVTGEWGYNSKVAFDPSTEICGLAWDDDTNTLYYIGLVDAGMFLGAVDVDTHEISRLTEPRHISISDLRAGGGRLYYGSIASGKDEAHCFDLATRTEYSLTESAFGSFQPSAPRGGLVALTTYDKHGYHLATQDFTHAVRMPELKMPRNVVNPRWRRWNIPIMDKMVWTDQRAESSERNVRQRRFSKFTNILRPHSWLPIDMYPPQAMDENDLTMKAGATVMSQSLLSDAVTWLAAGWTRAGGKSIRGGMTYSGLGPRIDVGFQYGGAPQVVYSLFPSWFAVNRRSHLDFTARVSLPLVLGSGRWISTLSPAVEYYHINGLIYKPLTEFSGEAIQGVERLTMSLAYSVQSRTALAEFQPRWGFAARIARVSNPFNDDFATLTAASVAAWIPGVVRPHGIRMRAAWQKLGGQKKQYRFQSKEVFPRGARYDLLVRDWRSVSVDYQLPVWYPEAGIPGFLYFKRIRLNAFFDYAWHRDYPVPINTLPVRYVNPWSHLRSWGGDLIVDMSPLRIPATNHLTARLTVAFPSDSRRPYMGLSFGLPF